MIAAILLAVTGAATARDAGGFQEAFVRSPARVEACPGYEEFRRRAYERLQASVVHPLRMLARTQAEEEKARCEQLRSRLENTFANDWSGWGERDGMVEVRRDTQSLDLVSALAEFDAVHELSLEVVGLDVVRNGNRFEHKATFLVVARSHRLGDSTRTVERKSSMTGFGDLERASRELAGHPRVMASSILDDRRFLRTARVESLDSSAGTFRFVKGPGGIIPGRRLGVVDSNGQLQAWAIALGPEDRSRRWVARPVVGGLPSEGGILREIPGDVAWRADLSWLQVGDAWGGELGGGPRLPVGSWVRAGLDGMLRVHDFGSIAPTGLPLSWGVGLGVEPVVSFQRTFRRWAFEADVRAGLRMDLVSVDGADQPLFEGGGWARRGELVAAFQASVLWAMDPRHAWGATVRWDAFQGRGAWEADDRTVVDSRGAGSWRFGLAYRFWP